MKLGNLKINKDNFKNNNLSLSKKIVAGVIAVGLVAGGIGFSQVNDINKTPETDDIAANSYEDINYDELSTMTFDFENTDTISDEGLFLTIFNTDGKLMMYLEVDNQGYVSDKECYLIPGEDNVVGITYNDTYLEYEIDEVQKDTEYQLNLDCDSNELTVNPVPTNQKTM